MRRWPASWRSPMSELGDELRERAGQKHISLTEGKYVPAMDRIQYDYLALGEAEVTRASDIEYAMYRAGVVEGLAMAAEIADRELDEDE